MKKTLASFLITLSLLTGVALVPVVAHAQSSGLIPCTGVVVNGEGKLCTFEDFIKLISNVIDFLIFIIAPVIAALLILYAGFLLLTSGASAESRGKAKTIMMDAIVGIVIAMLAWIIIKFILIALGYDDSIFPRFYS